MTLDPKKRPNFKRTDLYYEVVAPNRITDTWVAFVRSESRALEILDNCNAGGAGRWVWEPPGTHVPHQDCRWGVAVYEQGTDNKWGPVSP